MQSDLNDNHYHFTICALIPCPLQPRVVINKIIEFRGQLGSSLTDKPCPRPVVLQNHSGDGKDT